MFWTCRQVCETGGTGRIVRAIAFIGLVASVAAIVQRAQSIDLLYGVWRPARCRRAAVRPVRQPQSLRDVGHHGVPAGLRLSAGPRAAQRTPHLLSQRGRECAEAAGLDAHLARRRCVRDDAGGADLDVAVRAHRADERVRAQHGAVTAARRRSRVRRWVVLPVRAARARRRCRSPTSTCCCGGSTKRSRARRQDADAWRSGRDADRLVERFSASPEPAPAPSARPSPFTRPRSPATLSAKLTTTTCNWSPKGARGFCCRRRSPLGFFVVAGWPQPQTGSVIELSDAGRRVRRHGGRAGAELLGNRIDDAG